jgi:hypothetical protein
MGHRGVVLARGEETQVRWCFDCRAQPYQVWRWHAAAWALWTFTETLDDALTRAGLPLGAGCREVTHTHVEREAGAGAAS